MNTLRLAVDSAKWAFAIIGTAALVGAVPVALIYALGIVLGLVH